MLIKKRFFTLLLLFCFILASIFFVGGCSNANSPGGGSAGSSKLSSGNVAFSFSWPAHGKYIPFDTATIRISISGDGLSSAQITTVNYGTASVTVEGLPLGNKAAQISSLDSIGNILTTSNITFTIEAGKTAAASATLGVSFNNTAFTPSTLTIAPNNWLFFYNNSDTSHTIIFSGINAVYTIPANSSQSVYLDSEGSFTIYLDSVYSDISMSLTVQNTPQISSLSPTSGIVGSFVTIAGVNFGASRGLSTVKFNGTTATPTSWSSTSLVCAVPTGAATGNVVVTVSGIASNGVSFTVTPSAPQIISLNPTNGEVESSVTITGLNFGSTQGTSTVTFNGTTATIITSWVAGQIVCAVPNSTTTGNVVVTVNSVSSNGMPFTVNQKVIVGGWFTTYNGTARSRIARIHSDGTVDTTFNPGTGASGEINSVKSVVAVGEGQIMIGGNFGIYDGTFQNCIARIHPSGVLDTTFNPGTGADGSISSVSVRADGKILIGGGFNNYNGTGRVNIARVNSDGTLDASFDPGTGITGTAPFGFPVASVVVSSDKTLVGGNFTTYDGAARSMIVRINSNGTLDATFNPGTGADNDVFSIAIQSDGKILIGGRFNNYDGTGRPKIARLNSDGTLDATFNPGTGADSDISAITIQGDGKILIGGYFTTYNGTGRNSIARLNSDGTLDTSFDPGAGADDYILSIAIQNDGKIIIGGGFANYNGTSRVRIARLNSGGTLDTSFDPGAGANEWIKSIAIQ